MSTARRVRLLAWAAVGLWVGVTALLAPLAGRTGTVESTDPTLAMTRDAEATRAVLRERQAFPGADTPVAVVVYVRGGGLTAPDRPPSRWTPSGPPSTTTRS